MINPTVVRNTLKSRELAAANSIREGEIVSRVVGKSSTSRSKKKNWGAGLFVVAILIVAAFFLGAGNLIPGAISERLIETMDVQYADAFKSKVLVFAEALKSGDVPDNTVKRLNDYGVKVGYGTLENFTEANKTGTPLSLLYQNQVLSATTFVDKVSQDTNLYNAITSATYDRAAYFYDDAAKTVFQKLGTSRNNYTENSNFEEVTAQILGSQMNLSVNNVELVEQTGSDGNVTTSYEVTGDNTLTTAADFVEKVRAKNRAATTLEATLNAADTLNVADTAAKEQRSSLLFLTFMENISKMKAGEGNDSKITEVMNYLYETKETEVLDVSTGEVVKTSGSMVDSPSFYAVLSGSPIDISDVANYSSDRILKSVENKVGVSSAGSNTLLGTLSSIGEKVKGIIGRFLPSGFNSAGSEVTVATPIIEQSLISNGFETLGGVSGGEMLVEGAINVGKELAKASGGSAGDSNATLAYMKLNSEVLALEAAADRLNRSPFDITSKNTFLGSIVYRLAISIPKLPNTLLSSTAIFSNLVGNSVGALLPTTFADDFSNQYLSNFGDCETINNIGAVGSATCSTIITFDTSTLNDPFNDPDFVAFVNQNTDLNASGNREILPNSKLADYIKYNDERITPIGVTDGGILDALLNGSSKIPVLSSIINMIKTWLGASETEKQIASGQAFVNSSSNPDWADYKYAQRYISLARATDALRQYDGETTAYSKIPFFEGTENPVIAFLNNYYNTIVAEK